MGAPDSFESRIVPLHGITMEFVRVSALRGKGLLKLLMAPLLLLRARDGCRGASCAGKNPTLCWAWAGLPPVPAVSPPGCC